MTSATAEATANSASSRRGRRPQTEEEKQRSAQLRAEGKIVEEYLRTLDLPEGRQRRTKTEDPAKIQKRLERLMTLEVPTEPLKTLELFNARILCAEKLAAAHAAETEDDLEVQFCACAKDWANHHRITHDAFVACGVSKSVLKRAGIEVSR